jgi:hypothetical protein
MAKKEKKKRRSKRNRYTTGGRVDMRTGGRVSKFHGGPHNEDKDKERFERRQEELRDRFSVDRLNQNIQPNRNGGGMSDDGDIINIPGIGGGDSNIGGGSTTASNERRERIERSANLVEGAAQGMLPETAVIPTAIPAGIDPKTGQPIEGQKITTMQNVPGFVDSTASATPAQQTTPEAVTTGQVTTAQTPQQVQASKMDAATVDTQAQVEAAQGQLSDDAIAEAAGVDRVTPTEGATVTVQEGAVAETIKGTLSPEAKATAATNAGTNLARVTRAKKQLRNAGLQEDAITQLGNDPEALEDKLTDFTEQERGVIAGLPEEALVSNQLDSLLNGMEEGEIPAWAKPAVASVESMLARRGLSASSVGRDNLFNAIIQSAIPLAQSNAQAIQQSVSQQRSIEAQVAESNAQREQQAVLNNAKNVFQLDVVEFSAEQQTSLANSKFFQTISLTEASADQQSTIQNAVLMSQANLAEANLNQQAQIQNAKNFLQMDMANLSSKQQANMLKAQQTQQRILSNQAAQNASNQFNATSENQTNQFMANLNAQINQYNSAQANAMSQFNATQSNAAEARRAGREADINKFNAQLITQVDQFNSQQDFARNQWNAQNAAAVEASNVQWRRQANTINTAAQNQINMQNAMNAFNLSSQSMSFLWQELRDQADFDFRAFENQENRNAQILATAIANEGKSGQVYDDYLTSLISSLRNSYQSGLG